MHPLSVAILENSFWFQFFKNNIYPFQFSRYRQLIHRISCIFGGIWSYSNFKFDRFQTPCKVWVRMNWDHNLVMYKTWGGGFSEFCDKCRENCSYSCQSMEYLEFLKKISLWQSSCSKYSYGAEIWHVHFITEILFYF